MFLVAVLAQAVFAGLFVTGDVGFLDMHAFNANIAAVSVALWFIAALVLRAPRRIVITGVIAAVVTVAQVGIGFARIIPLHIPVGVVLFAAALRLVQLAFTYQGGRE
jgi:hypothetical protein